MKGYWIAGNLLHSGNRKIEKQIMDIKRATHKIRAHVGTTGMRRQGFFSFQK
jgi:hypothetical protein